MSNILQRDGLTIETLGRLSYKSKLGINLKKNLHYFVKEELLRKYYTPKIIKIKTLKETRGFSFWQVVSDAGELSFTLQDTSRSIAKISEDRAFVFDICGNRYEIESLSALDKKSFRKLELYL